MVISSHKELDACRWELTITTTTTLLLAPYLLLPLQLDDMAMVLHRTAKLNVM